ERLLRCERGRGGGPWGEPAVPPMPSRRDRPGGRGSERLLRCERGRGGGPWGEPAVPPMPSRRDRPGGRGSERLLRCERGRGGGPWGEPAVPPMPSRRDRPGGRGSERLLRCERGRGGGPWGEPAVPPMPSRRDRPGGRGSERLLRCERGRGGGLTGGTGCSPRALMGGTGRSPMPKRRGRDLNPRRTFRPVRDFQSRSFGRSDTSPRRPKPSAGPFRPSGLDGLFDQPVPDERRAVWRGHEATCPSTSFPPARRSNRESRSVDRSPAMCRATRSASLPAPAISIDANECRNGRPTKYSPGVDDAPRYCTG